MTLSLTNISSDPTLKLRGPEAFEQQGAQSLKPGDIIEGIVTSVSKEEVEVSFSLPSPANDPARTRNLPENSKTETVRKTFPESSIKNARIGEKRSFEVIKTTGDSYVLKDLGPAVTGDGKVSFTGVDMASLAQVKSFNDTMGIGEQDEENTLDKIHDRMSDEDAAGFCDEGLSVKEYLEEQLESALDRVKLGLEIKRRYSEEAGKKIKEQSREIRAHAVPAGTERERRIAAHLGDADLPVTPGIIDSILAAQDLAMSSHALSSSAKAVLIDKGTTPTVTSYYKASGITVGRAGLAPISDEDFEALLPRIEQEVKSANEASGQAPVTEEDARWLIDHDLPVNTQTLLMKSGLDGFTPDGDTVLTAVIDGVKKGFEPAEAPLPILGFEAFETPAAHTDFPETEGIFSFDDKVEAEKFFEADYSSEIAAVTARRRLEESRLTLFVQSRARGEALRGTDDGSVIEGIEASIRSLKAVEERYYSDCFREVGDSATPEKIDRLAEIVGSFDELGRAPAYILSSTLEVRTSITVTELNAEGDRLKAVFARAEQTYEAVGTQIRGDLGDSITKAFSNIDELLTLSGFDLTDTNRRAARILGYNRMELSESNMTAIKAYDLEVRGLIDAMRPVVAAELVKRGIDPLNVPLPELKALLKQLGDEKGRSTDEKYSEFLVRLDREGALTQEERSAYIGIYRLLARIEKTDGAVIGDCLRRGVELTMGNLLSADRTRRHGHVDRKVDDSFGALEETVSHNVSISEQILGAMTLGKLDPQRQLSMSPEEFLEDLRRSSAPDTQNVDVELMKEDIARAGEADFEKAFLHFFEEPATVGNLLAMQEMIAAPDIYRKLTSLSLSSPDGEETSTQSSGLSESEGTTRAEAEESIGLSDLAPDIAGSLEELQGSYDGLLSDEAALVDRAYDNPGITSSEALRLSRIGAQISLLSSFARKNYYELPVRTEAGTVLMNLTLRRGSDNKGLIGIRFRSGLPVDMTMRAGENTVDGVLTCGDRSLEGPLKEALTEVTDSLKGSGYEEVRLFFAGTGTDERSYLERIGQGSGSETENAEKLFGIAKTVTRALATRL